MNRQCNLSEVGRPDERMKLMLAADDRLKFYTHVNKGKKYPYANERQNSRMRNRQVTSAYRANEHE